MGKEDCDSNKRSETHQRGSEGRRGDDEAVAVSFVQGVGVQAKGADYRGPCANAKITLHTVTLLLGFKVDYVCLA